MNRTPSLPNSNRFSILPVFNVTRIDQSDKTVQFVQTSEDPPHRQKARPRLERRLPAQLVIAALDESDSSSQSLNLKVGIETTDTREAMSLTALVDSGATGRFIDRDYVTDHPGAVDPNPSAQC